MEVDKGCNLLVWLSREQWDLLTEASREHWLLACGRGGCHTTALEIGDDMADGQQVSPPADSRSWRVRFSS
jgi:hypothetical protein